MKSYKFIIMGKVQGVYYRISVKNNASKHGYKGYVKNLPDDTVEAFVRCEETQLNNFIKILKQGSQSSNVTNIQQYSSNEIFNNNFEVR